MNKSICKKQNQAAQRGWFVSHNQNKMIDSNIFNHLTIFYASNNCATLLKARPKLVFPLSLVFILSVKLNDLREQSTLGHIFGLSNENW